MTAPSQLVYMADAIPRLGFLTRWERVRHREAHLLVQLVAEAFGVFLYSFLGGGSQAAFVIGNLTNSPGVGSVFQIGFAYVAGVVLSISICMPTSGGNFNPCFTIANMVFKGFPIRKGLLFILARIIGAYIAMIVLYLQYRGLILPGSNLGSAFWNEFSCDFVLAVVVWSVLDPTNMFAPPPVIPIIVALGYGAVLWGFSPVGVAMNSARDLGGRLMVLTIWGTKSAGGPYAAIAAMTNIPATLLGVLFYEVFLTDSARVIPNAQIEYYQAQQAHDAKMMGHIYKGLSLPGEEAGDSQVHLQDLRAV